MISPRRQFKILHDLLLKEEPRSAEAIVWLQGDRYDRSYKVLALYKQGYGKKIVITGNNDLIGRQARRGENNISLDEMKNFLLQRGVKAKDLLIDEGAMNTKDQAKNVLRIAKREKWRRLILVGSAYYQPRVFLTFLKQGQNNKWPGVIINQPAFITGGKKPAGRIKTARVLFAEEFNKVKKYKKDLALIGEGIKYLAEKKFRLRKATKNDRRQLFNWANDPDVRANAKHPEPINWSGHVVWFNDKLRNRTSYIFILEKAKKNIGLVRFDKKPEGLVISYLIDKYYRGQGWGEMIMREGIKVFQKKSK
jgi:uncharacterized SAM-binding protein YcdF (DUF218 family)